MEGSDKKLARNMEESWEGDEGYISSSLAIMDSSESLNIGQKNLFSWTSTSDIRQKQ
ncbi:unnamed protein product [Brassica rapa subsp. narinosa]